MDRMRWPAGIVLAAIPVLLGGCGGGGDDPVPATLTAQNAELAAGGGVELVDMLADMGEMVEGFTEVFDDTPAQTVPCDFGDATPSVNDTVPLGELSTGDSASMTFEGCVFGEGDDALTMDGTVSLVATEVTSSGPGSFTIGLRVTFDSFTVLGGGTTVNVDGGWTMTLSIEDDVTVGTLLTGDRLSIFVQEAGEAQSVTLSAFRLARSLDTATGAYSWELDATLSTSEIGGTVTFTTNDPFTGVYPGHPDTGSATIEGAAGATLVLLAQDDTNVQLLLDADGDGTAETTIQTTWTVLDEA